MMPEMRRKDRQLPEEEAVRLLQNCRFGVLCTVCADGTPYGIPMNHALIGRSLYMHCAADGGLKLENIARSPKACFTVVGQADGAEEGPPRLHSAIAFGRVSTALSEEERILGIEALRQHSRRSRPSGTGTARKVLVLRFDIEQLTGKGR